MDPDYQCINYNLIVSAIKFNFGAVESEHLKTEEEQPGSCITDDCPLGC
jgi:hypothetical protein